MRGADAVIEPARILVVDDDVKLLRLLAIRLRRAGWLIETAESGRQALAAIPRFRPQVAAQGFRTFATAIWTDRFPMSIVFDALESGTFARSDVARVSLHT